MIDPPELKLGDWIQVGHHKGIVGHLYAPENRETMGIGILIYDALKPTSDDFSWDGTNFFFPERPDFGGYADKNPMYAEYVRELKDHHRRHTHK